MKSALKPLKNAKKCSACGGLLPPAAPATGLQILRLHTRFRTRVRVLSVSPRISAVSGVDTDKGRPETRCTCHAGGCTAAQSHINDSARATHEHYVE
eukprot:6827895-Prymnesium_polylepis.1